MLHYRKCGFAWNMFRRNMCTAVSLDNRLGTVPSVFREDRQEDPEKVVIIIKTIVQV